jgi:hypothetical protein
VDFGSRTVRPVLSLYLYLEIEKGHGEKNRKIHCKLLILKYFTGESLFLKGMDGNLFKSLSLEDRCKGGGNNQLKATNLINHELTRSGRELRGCDAGNLTRRW